MAELKDRLNLALQTSGKNKFQLAKYCGISSPSVLGWFNGTTKMLSADNAIKASIFLGVNVNWLINGTGDMRGSVIAVEPDDQQPDSLISIPEFNIKFGAGSCAEPSFEEVTEAREAYYRAEWFLERHVKAEYCKRFKVHGESMMPILYDGDSILVDCSKQEIQSGKIYAFCFGDEMRVKRLHKKLNGGILVHSENPTIPDETIEPEDVERFTLIGRVIDRSGCAPF